MTQRKLGDFRELSSTAVSPPESTQTPQFLTMSPLYLVMESEQTGRAKGMPHLQFEF